MNKIVPISELQSQAKKYVDQVRKTFEEFLATQQEMAFPDWKKRLQRTEKESQQGKGLALEAYLHKRKH